MSKFIYIGHLDLENCNLVVKNELQLADINIFENVKIDHPDVDTTVAGFLGCSESDLNELRDFWPAMVRTGSNKYDILKDNFSFNFRRYNMYWTVNGYVPLYVANEIYALNKDAIRAGGDCGCREPSIWATHHLVCGHRCVTNYHIDTQEGLNQFVSVLKSHRLI